MPHPLPPRLEQLIDSVKMPVPPKKAASVIFVRPILEGEHNHDSDYQILMTQRTDKASFAPSAWVFAGGALDADDALDAQDATSAENALPIIGLDNLPTALHTAARAALRENFEELGILCAVRQDNHAIINGRDIEILQNDLQGVKNNKEENPNKIPLHRLNRAVPLAPQLRRAGWALDARELTPLCRWVADPQLPRRFDTWFFLAPMPDGYTAAPDGIEQVAVRWLTPQTALSEHAAGRLPMLFPTVRTLQRLAAWPRVAQLFAALRHGWGQAVEIADDWDTAHSQPQQPLPSSQPLPQQTRPRPKSTFEPVGHMGGAGSTSAQTAAPLPWQSMPRSGQVGPASRDVRHFTEDEAAWGELALVHPTGVAAQRHRLDWQSQHPVPLRRNVLRLTAPNGGVMTGPGTNSYLVGQSLGGWLVIDPGPDDVAHLQRLLDAAWADDENAQHFNDLNPHTIPRGIRAIVCTHSHPDHARGARRLQAMCAGFLRQHKQLAHSGIIPPIVGMPSGSHSPSHSVFTPDVVLEDGQTIEIEGIFPSSRHTLCAIHTPGHAANHLCLWLQQDALAFTGDHVMGTGTPVIAPSDGHMGDYIQSLYKLKDLCQTQAVQFLLPAHGHALHAPVQTIERLIAHRLHRHERVVQAVADAPHESLATWLATVYGPDLPAALRDVAAASLRAHLQWMAERGEIDPERYAKAVNSA